MTIQLSDYQAIMSAATNPQDAATLAFAGVIASRSSRKSPYDTPIAGLDEDQLRLLKSRYFPDAQITFCFDDSTAAPRDRLDEFDDLLNLLLDHRTTDDDESRWLAHAVATASMAENHLWQDMGLPNRATLSGLMMHYFTSLAKRNVGDMKWKKFFYRQLCEREGIPICRSPSCNVCCDYDHCFGSEESTSSQLLTTV
jgi:nitrogen fixation protein NifQ